MTSAHSGNAPGAPERARASQALDAGLAALALEVPTPTRAKLLGLADFLLAWGRRTNLTGHRGLVPVVEHLIVDALALQTAVEERLEGACSGDAVDLGSGAGFPGIPVAMLRPELHVQLVESRERRHHFQRAACREFGLSNVEPRWGRMEALPPRPADLVFAQAVAAPRQVLNWAMDWVRPGGLLVIPGGTEPPEPGSHPEASRSGAARYGARGASGSRFVWWCRRQES